MAKTQKIQWIILISVMILAAVSVNWTNFLIIKYLSIAYAYVGIGFMICKKLHLKQLRSYMIARILGISSLLLVLFYSILTLDTFYFHALTWLPGMLRYVIYDAYGILYIIFILPGIGLYFGDAKHNRSKFYA